MANWKYKISVKNEHDAYRAERMTIQEVAKSLSRKLRFLPCYQYDEKLQEIASWLISDVENVDDYDRLLEELYDWGDQEIPPLHQWTPNKMCWIESV